MLSRKFIIGLLIISLIMGIGGGIVYWTVAGLPNISSLEEYTPYVSSKVYSSDEKMIAELYLERRTFVPHYQIPEQVKNAFISVEDIRFYKHPGVDFIGIARALWRDILAGSFVEGGSTITQQLARMLFLKPEKSLKRKIKEALLSIQIEKKYTKDEILGMYLNQAYFGTRSYGIEAASQTYFGKKVQEINLAEAALLAAIPKAPSVYSPFKNPEKTRKRRSMVLGQMFQNGFITDSQLREAEQTEMPISPYFRKYEAPYFIETLRQNLESKYGDELYTSGYTICSTLDYQMQKYAEEAIQKGISAVEKRTGKPGVEAALLALDLRNGHVKAMVGGVDFWETQFNRATKALRQPGSVFKPIVYMTAIKKGMKSSDIILDAPVAFKGAKPGQVWSPQNYDGTYHGGVTLKTALSKSLNAATVRLASNIGIENVIETAQMLGIKSEFPPYLPVAIGAADVTLIDMVSAYAILASGLKVTPLLYEKILNRNGIIVEEKRPSPEELLAQKDIEEMRVLLRAVIEEGTATKAKEIMRPVYGKTGTTNDYTDAWFIGFDDRIAVGIWIGRDNHRPIGPRETGSRAALPIWIEFMKKVPLQTLLGQSP